MNTSPPSDSTSPFYDKDFATAKITPNDYKRLIKQLNALRVENEELRRQLAELTAHQENQPRSQTTDMGPGGYQ